MDQKTQRLYSFGPFRLDAREYLLMLDGKAVPLPPKAFEALLMLVENAGHLVDKNELMRRLWPDTFVEDGNLAKHVSLLRKTLSEASNGQEYIETIPKRGYRFILEATELANNGSGHQSELSPAENQLRAASQATSEIHTIFDRSAEKDCDFEDHGAAEVPVSSKPLGRDQRKRRVNWWYPSAIGFSLLGIAGTVLWVAAHKTSPPSEIKFRQLTASSSEDPIRYGAISPDGKYLAYGDLKGIHVMLIKTGESQTVPQPEILQGNRVDWQFFRWFPDGTRFLVNQNPPEEREYGYSATIWSVSVVGGPPRRLRQDAGVESISPDGSLVAFTTDTQNLWLMGPNGDQVRRLYNSAPNTEIWNVRFSPNGKRLMYWEYPDGDLESRDLTGGDPVKTLPATRERPRDYLWLPDGRIVYSLAEPSPNVDTCNLWELRVDVHTGKPLAAPERLTNWVGTCAENLSATADGKTIAFQQWTGQASVYVANVTSDRTHITVPVRLTASQSQNIPTAWTADSSSVIFKSTFNGETGIYKQSLDRDTPELLVTGVGDIFDHTPFSPDGSWFLYDAHRIPGTQNQVMRSSIGGGPAQFVLTGADRGVRCTRSPSPFCVLAEGGLGPKFTFSKFDPLTGRSSELAKINLDPETDFFWDLSPDGRRVAVLEGLSGRIHVLSLTGETAQEIKTKEMETTQFITWAADGQALFVSRPTRRGFQLLRLDLDGNTHVLWEETGGLGTSALTSPDGKHLAIRGWSMTSNFWTMTNF